MHWITRWTTPCARSWAAMAILAALSTCVMPTPASAQYFGRNKVQYDRLRFRVLLTDHFRVHFYPAESLATADGARMAERWYARHSTTLHHTFSGSPLIFYADPPDFQQSNVIEGEISQGTGGVTEGLRERVIMPFTGSYAETDHVLGHELVHVFQYRLAASSKGGLRSIQNIPLWLIEGMAEYLSLGRHDANTAMWLRDALRRNDMPTITQLTRDSKYFPYRYGQALWAFIGGTWGDDAVNRVFRASLTQGWEKGVASALGLSLDSLSARWHTAIRADYSPVIAQRMGPTEVGRGVAVAGDRGEQNISPAVSHDGTKMAYFSSRGLFGVDLYVADVATGRVIRQLTSVTSDAHFDALSFISSAGAWSPDGSRLAFVVYAQGDQELEIVDVRTGRRERTISLPGVTAMADPAWSPDGQRIALTGFKGGLSDLYVYNLTTGQSQQLTSDREAQLQPTWSPDGQSLAFATDAGAETDFSALRYAPMRLAVLDVSTTAIRLLPRLGGGKHINPQYAQDGQSLFFVSDHDGISDIYRMTIADGRARRVSSVATGVSGITALSPAISVARNTGTLLFSVFDQQGFSIRALDANELERANLVAASEESTTPPRASALPPVATREGLVADYLQNPQRGLPAPSTPRLSRYATTLKLDYVGGPQIGVATGGGYGTGVAGGIALAFSDELGNQTVQSVVQANGDIRDIGGQALYLNRTQRANWGVTASHIPLVSGFVSYDNTTISAGGEEYEGVVYTQALLRQYFQNAQFVVQYPFSQTKRLEFGLGGQRVAFSTIVDSVYTIAGTAVRQARYSPPSASALTFATASAAFVGDYSFFGYTSPVAGGRYRFEVAPNMGTINYATAVADYRRYLLARPFTFAFRGMHVGRYGSGAESERLQSFFVGQPFLIRGYDPNSFDVSECTPSAASNDCPQFNRLSGSRMAILNAELRIPLLGTEQFGLIPFKLLPVEVSPFVDAGVAWRNGDPVTWRFSQTSVERIPVFSTGVSVRANIFGYAVAEFYWAKPFQRAQRNGIFGFQLQPGW